MRNIWTIFKTDIRTLSRCFFACVVVLAIALLPSLYAWLNIYSNWDPYGSTGGISIAVVRWIGAIRTAVNTSTRAAMCWRISRPPPPSTGSL